MTDKRANEWSNPMEHDDPRDDAPDSMMTPDAVEDAVLDYLNTTPGALDGVGPMPDLWPGIEARITTRVLPLTPPARPLHRRLVWLRTAAAATVLVAVSAGITYVATTRSMRGSTSARTAVASNAPAASPQHHQPAESPSASQRGAGQGAVPDAGPQTANGTSGGGHTTVAGRPPESHPGVAVHAVTSTPEIEAMKDAEAVYGHEIARLHAVIAERRSQLNPATLAIIEQNLHVIDQAIAQSRAALAKDPASQFLGTQLNHTLEKKVELLRTAALLPRSA